MNYFFGVIYLMIASQQGIEAFIQALLVVLLIQLAWHMKRPFYQHLFRLLAFALSLYNPNPHYYWFFILYVVADLLLFTGGFYVPFAGTLLLAIYGFYRQLFAFEVLVLLGALILLAFVYKIELEKHEKQEDEQRELRAQILEIEKNQLKEEVTREQLREYYILEERSRLSRELHDSVGHSLSTQLIQLKAIESLVEKDPPRAKAMLHSLGEFTQESMNKVRQVLADLKPPRILGEDVVGAIMKLSRDFEERHGIRVNFQASQELGLVEEDIRELLYRAVREFLNNSLKHAEATRIDVVLIKQQQNLQLTLKDNGKGCEEVQMNLGLRGLMELVFSLDGEMDISTAPGEGFTLRIGVKER